MYLKMTYSELLSKANHAMQMSFYRAAMAQYHDELKREYYSSRNMVMFEKSIDLKLEYEKEAREWAQVAGYAYEVAEKRRREGRTA